MKNNIGITAELLSLIKSRDNHYYNYFISNKIRLIYKILCFLIPKSKIEKIVQSRLLISKEFEEFTLNNNFNTLIDLGCGYSLSNFTKSINMPVRIFVDCDFENVLKKKKKILDLICKENNINYPSNYIQIPTNLIFDDLGHILKHYIKNDTLILLEGVTPYFKLDEFINFFKKLAPLLNENKNLKIFGQENKPFKDIFYSFIRNFIYFLINKDNKVKFESKEEMNDFFEKLGLEAKVYEKNNIIYYQIN